MSVLEELYDDLAVTLESFWEQKPTLGVYADLYLIGSYVYYVLEEEWFLSDPEFDRVCQWLFDNFNDVQRKAMHADCFVRSALKAGTGYSIQTHHDRIKDLAHACVRRHKEPMATKIEDAKPVTREITIQGLPCVVTFQEEGITIQRKGDRHRGKRGLDMEWDDLLNYAQPFKHKDDDKDEEIVSVPMDDDYEPVSFLEYQDGEE